MLLSHNTKTKQTTKQHRSQGQSYENKQETEAWGYWKVTQSDLGWEVLFNKMQRSHLRGGALCHSTTMSHF